MKSLMVYVSSSREQPVTFRTKRDAQEYDGSLDSMALHAAKANEALACRPLQPQISERYRPGKGSKQSSVKQSTEIIAVASEKDAAFRVAVDIGAFDTVLRSSSIMLCRRLRVSRTSETFFGHCISVARAEFKTFGNLLRPQRMPD